MQVEFSAIIDETPVDVYAEVEVVSPYPEYDHRYRVTQQPVESVTILSVFLKDSIEIVKIDDFDLIDLEEKAIEEAFETIRSGRALRQTMRAIKV